MKYTKPTKLKFTIWQEIIMNIDEENISLNSVYKKTRFNSIPTIKGYLELLKEKGLITIQDGYPKIVRLTETGKAFQKQYLMQLEVIPVAGENNVQENN